MGRSGLNASLVLENKEHLSNLPLIGRFDLSRLCKGHASSAGVCQVSLFGAGEEKSLLHTCTWGGDRGRKEEAENLT